jgi:hypothetical protein
MAALRNSMREDEAEVPEDPGVYGYLHLSEVRFMTPTGMNPTNTLWRVRISEVSAWSFQHMKTG